MIVWGCTWKQQVIWRVAEDSDCLNFDDCMGLEISLGHYCLSFFSGCEGRFHLMQFHTVFSLFAQYFSGFVPNFLYRISMGGVQPAIKETSIILQQSKISLI